MCSICYPDQKPARLRFVLANHGIFCAPSGCYCGIYHYQYCVIIQPQPLVCGSYARHAIETTGGPASRALHYSVDSTPVIVRPANFIFMTRDRSTNESSQTGPAIVWTKTHSSKLNLLIMNLLVESCTHFGAQFGTSTCIISCITSYIMHYMYVQNFLAWRHAVESTLSLELPLTPQRNE